MFINCSSCFCRQRLWLEHAQNFYIRLTSGAACKFHTFLVYLSLDLSGKLIAPSLEKYVALLQDKFVSHIESVCCPGGKFGCLRQVIVIAHVR